MTHEQRLDRLERIAKLFVRAGVRYRRDLREVGENLNIIVNMQIKNEERFTRNEAAFQSRSVEYEKRLNRNEKRVSRNEEKLAMLSQTTDQKIAELTESQARTDHNLAELIKIVRRGRNGSPHA
jgi:hypothetical protein